MRWLLTVRGDLHLDELCLELERLDSTVDASGAVPLDDGHALPAEGPADLPARLERAGLEHVTAYPDSELELYE